MSSIMNLLSNPVPVESGKRIVRDSLVEFLATTVFVFTGTLSAVSTGYHKSGQAENDVARVLPIAMSFGIAILALAHSIGHLSGGHMNPGVSLLMFFRSQISGVKLASYWLAQFVGSLLGSALVWGSTSEIKDVEGIDRPPFTLGATTLSDDLSAGNGFLIEFMGSFLFYFVIAQTALDKRGIATTAFPAIPIGLVLVATHVCLIPFTGCGVNPARTFGPSMVTCMTGNCSDVVDDWYWIYYIGPFAAAFCVAEITTWMSWEMDDDEEGDSQTMEAEGAEQAAAAATKMGAESTTELAA